MYTVVPIRKKSDIRDQQYNFKDFASFYNIGSLITYPLVGRYSVGIKTDKIGELQEFIKISSKYSALNITIYAPESVVNYVSLYDQTMPIKGVASPFEVFKELITSKHILFGKGMMYLLYNSVEHEVSDMEEALSLILQEYGARVEITEEMLEKLFVLNKTTYPRSVMISYLQLDRYRESRLNKSIEDMGNDVVLGAIVKNLKKLFEEKAKYYRTGCATQFLKSVDTKNLMLMYRVFIVERNGLNDVALLLSLYERGVSANDFVQR